MELSKLSFGLAVAASFICGAVTMSLFQSDPQQQPQTYQQQFVEEHIAQAPEQQATAVAPVINKQVAEVNSNSSAAVSKTELEQQVAELKLQVENQQAAIDSYRSSAVSYTHLTLPTNREV